MSNIEITETYKTPGYVLGIRRIYIYTTIYTKVLSSKKLNFNREMLIAKNLKIFNFFKMCDFSSYLKNDIKPLTGRYATAKLFILKHTKHIQISYL